MDKNMIHIDDLVRQRMAGGEESGRPGGWLQMKDLLDKKMPVNTPPVAGGINWQRVAVVVGAAALLVALSVGGYQVATSLRSDAGTDTAVERTEQDAMNTSNGNTSGSPANASIASVGEEGSDANSLTGNATVTTNSSNAAETDNDAVAANTTNSTGTERTVNQSVASVNDNRRNVSSAANTASAHAERNNRPTVTSNNAADVANVPANNRTSTESNLKTSSVNQTAIPTNGATPERTYAANTNNNNRSLNREVVESAIGSTSAKANGNNNKPSAKEEPAFVLLKDSMRMIERVDRWIKGDRFGQGRYESEVIRVAKVPVYKQVLSADEALASNTEAHNAATNAASGTSAGAADNQSEMPLVPLSDSKVASKKKKNRNWNLQSFDEMVRNAKFNMGQVQFYPGVLAGVNTTIDGNKTMTGFQLGINGLFKFSERLSAMVELKYVSRFNNSMQLDDSYRNNLDFTYVNGVKTYTYDSVENYYKYSTLHSIEMPVSLRYSIHRFNLMAGVNMAYNFGLTPEHVEREHNIIQESPSGSAINYSFEKTAPEVSIEDFSARFGFGYLIGAGYQLTPASQLDIRLVQTVLDNAASRGANKVSNTLYKSPSLQLTYSYRFSSNRPRKAR